MRTRFTVGSVTGWVISPNTSMSRSRVRSKPATVAYVYDSVYCYQIVAVFDGRFRPGNRSQSGQVQPSAIEAAEAHAERLNAINREMNP